MGSRRSEVGGRRSEVRSRSQVLMLSDGFQKVFAGISFMLNDESCFKLVFAMPAFVIGLFLQDGFNQVIDCEDEADGCAKQTTRYSDNNNRAEILIL